MLQVILLKGMLLLSVGMVCDIANGVPLNEFDTEKSSGGESLKVELLTRPFEEDSNILLTLVGDKATDDLAFDENSDDLELAEVNVFRPVFRYRVAVSKKVRGPQQF